MLFVKQLGVWIVTDRMQSDGEREYSQIWNYPPPDEGENSANFICPGFGPRQVRGDERSKIISTIDPRGPNVFLHHFTMADMSYDQKFGEKYPHRGWFSFGIGGEKVPAVEMHATWRGQTPLVTVIAPRRNRLDEGTYEDLSDGSRSGLRMSKGNVTLTYLAGRAVVKLKTASVEARAEAVLLLESGDAATGVALNCDMLRVNGVKRKIKKRDFEFRADDGGDIRLVEEVIIPSTFDWIETGEGIQPSYF